MVQYLVVVQLLVTVVLEFVILCLVSNIDVFVLSVKRQDVYIYTLHECLLTFAHSKQRVNCMYAGRFK